MPGEALTANPLRLRDSWYFTANCNTLPAGLIGTPLGVHGRTLCAVDTQEIPRSARLTEVLPLVYARPTTPGARSAAGDRRRVDLGEGRQDHSQALPVLEVPAGFRARSHDYDDGQKKKRRARRGGGGAQRIASNEGAGGEDVPQNPTFHGFKSSLFPDCLSA